MQAKDLMRQPVVTITPEAPISAAIALMLERRLSGLPVVESDGRLVGIVSEGDLLRRVELGTETRRPRWLEILRGAGRAAEDFVRSHGRKVHEVMTSEPITIDPEASLADIVERMARHGIKRLPVIEKGRVVGMVTRADLLRALADSSRPVEAPQPGDAEIRRAIFAACEKQNWAPRQLVGVDVHQGVVTLSGTILDERERQGLKVLAENIPGVVAVRDQLIWVEPFSGTYLAAPPAESAS
jgi:CBS domain-containing protein